MLPAGYVEPGVARFFVLRFLLYHHLQLYQMARLPACIRIAATLACQGIVLLSLLRRSPLTRQGIRLLFIF
jgi:hypothetical protein